MTDILDEQMGQRLRAIGEEAETLRKNLRDAQNDNSANADEVMRLRDELRVLREAATEACGWLPWHEPTHPNYEGARSDVGRRLRKALDPAKYNGCSS